MLKLHLLFPVINHLRSFCAHGFHSVKSVHRIYTLSVAFSRASVLTYLEGAYANFIVRGRHDGTATPTNAGTSDIATRLWRASRHRRGVAARHATIDHVSIRILVALKIRIFLVFARRDVLAQSAELFAKIGNRCSMEIDTGSAEWSRDTITGRFNYFISYIILSYIMTINNTAWNINYKF